MRVIILPSMPPNIFNWSKINSVTIKLRKINLNQLKEILENVDETKCYIRHKPTIELLEKEINMKLNPINEAYRYKEGDKLVIATLNYRPEYGREYIVEESNILLLEANIENNFS
ncbi:MAG: hypothetical protein DRN90_02800 [Thermoproteota archaeon]|nr:MAG: hypothetical protein DRN90_02800 [Candidatus Korarchaeota archaeon]